MEKLIRRYADFMLQSNYALATRKSYVGAVRNFYKWCLKQSANPDFDKADAHRQYLLYRARRGLSWQSINGDYSAIRLLYTKVLDRGMGTWINSHVHEKKKHCPGFFLPRRYRH